MPLVEMSGIAKAFGGVPALKGVDFALAPGSVHALVGENGAGKSTLMKILAGSIEPDAGTIGIDGRQARFRAPRQALAAGIVAIHQESSLCPDLTVIDNLFLGHPIRRRSGLLDWTAMRRRAVEVFRRLGVSPPLDAVVGDLSKAQAQFVQIARALVQDARVLILDEPSAALTPTDVDHLFAVVEGLRAGGRSAVYITHRLDEIFRIADRVTVMRDGCRIATAATAEVDQHWIIRHMVGRVGTASGPRHRRTPGDVLLRVESLSQPPLLADIGFEIREGEIVGLAGLVGSGRSELAQALMGLGGRTTGRAEFRGEPLRGSMGARIRRGLALLPEDRGKQGLILGFPVAHNLSLAVLRSVARHGLVRRAAERSLARDFIARLRIRPAEPERIAATLSGGNQQKVVVGKWLAAAPRVLLLDEPTQGVDVGAKAEIHALIGDLAAKGLGILLISSDLPEALGLADRLLVMYGGRIVAEFPHGVAADAVMRAASGLPAEHDRAA